MNPIQPVTTRPREISVAEPVSPALERVKLMLFQPFDLGKWFVIGFCAWLAFLGEGGGLAADSTRFQQQLRQPIHTDRRETDLRQGLNRRGIMS